MFVWLLGCVGAMIAGWWALDLVRQELADSQAIVAAELDDPGYETEE